jgi:uncharacterized membrane protein HdeD (DUF308 family)
MDTKLLQLLAKNWWLLLLRGLCGIVFGLLAMTWPGLTLVTLILFYGAFVAVEGILEIAAAIRGGTAIPRWWLALAGVVALAAAAATFFAPGVTALVLLYIIGGWAVARGVFEIIGAIQLRKEIDNEWLLIFSGAMSVIFGLCVFVWPGASAISLIWLIGAYAIVVGVLCIGLAFRLKKHHRAQHPALS